MRVDKYLWAIRLFKTRSEAAEACRLGRVRMGEDIVKAAKEVQAGQVLHVSRQGITLSYRVEDMPKNRVGAALVAQYATDVTAPGEREKIALRHAPAFERRDPRTGRPTKRERREIDRFKDFDED